ncbi:ATP-dependent DNA helicase RecQ [Echinicola jeungdonensis]|uniref:ATP-dependent DNA helicase RecQ n=1 Tax=Echinicola jeungdonensis TaxID=709343 RepID=A0ABV5J3N1_9BACT|nr:ATP-dependent DNA helicase RecQ [Echinicola jeungdonensis]MDN3668429.1 ATP-dependent DNA helicase RecQ [Echinicola jeungdonensis]
MKTKALSVLQKVYGYDDFRPMQEDIVLSVLSGKDTVALLPTGGGKSICFQVPALVMDGICVVVSPLIALMKDQVENLRKKGVLSAAIYSGMRKREIDTILDNCIYGNYKFLYVSPERLKTDLFLERFKRMKVNMVAVDEAHCISQWGYDFRPPYLEIAEIRKFHPEVPVIALTASATPSVKQDIIEKLKLDAPKVFIKSFARKNLSYAVREAENKLEKVVEILQKIEGSSIVYVRSRKACKEIAIALGQMGIPATFYHAGLDKEMRESRQQDWKLNRTRVMVATNAFGMGIDKPDVRSVIHVNIPENLENYYQEAGRAGRDEWKAYAVLLYTENDLKILQERAEQAYPPVDYIKRVYQSLANYYRIAVGSSLMVSYDFDIGSFTQTYNLDLLMTYHAIKVMQEEGLVELSEGFYAASTLKFLVDQTQLYEYQIAHAKLDPLIKILLRTYGGELFSDFLKIYEEKLAKVMQVSVAEIIPLFERMDQLGIVAYNKRKDKPQVTFLTPRYDAGKLPLNLSRIKERRENSVEKAKSMAQYVKNNILCRTVQIQQYFGEEHDKGCGICDVCLQKKKNLPAIQEKIRKRMLQSLEEGEVMTREELLEKVKAPQDDVISLELLRELEEEGQITTQADGRIKLETK